MQGEVTMKKRLFLGFLIIFMMACSLTPAALVPEPTMTATIANTATATASPTATATATVTPTVTLTPTITITPTITSTPTPVITTLLVDSFDSNTQSWELPKGMEIKDGMLQMSAQGQKLVSAVIPLKGEPLFDTKVSVSARVLKWIKGDVSEFGIKCRVLDAKDSYYGLTISVNRDDIIYGNIYKVKNGEYIRQIYGYKDANFSVTKDPASYTFTCLGSHIQVRYGSDLIAEMLDDEYAQGGMEVMYYSPKPTTKAAFEQIQIEQIVSSSPAARQAPASNENLNEKFGGGGTIVFSSDRENNTSYIYRMLSNGSKVAQLADQVGFLPYITPNGSVVIFVSIPKTMDGYPLYQVSTQNDVLKGKAMSLDFWSSSRVSMTADGKKIYFTKGTGDNADIYMADSDGTNPKRLTTNPKYDGCPSISAFDSWVVYTSDNKSSNVKIMYLSPDGKQTFPTIAEGNDAAFSPDGSMVAYSYGTSDNTQIYIYDMNGANYQLTNLPGLNDGPIFSPDGKYIVFESNSTGNYEVFAIDINGQHLVNLTNDPADDRAPYWGK
jgi:hypothetical protein